MRQDRRVARAQSRSVSKQIIETFSCRFLTNEACFCLPNFFAKIEVSKGRPGALEGYEAIGVASVALCWIPVHGKGPLSASAAGVRRKVYVLFSGYFLWRGHGHQREPLRRLRRPGRHVRQADLVRRTRVHYQAGARPDLGHHQGYALGTGTVRGERDERGQLQGDPVARLAKSLHVLYLQGIGAHCLIE